MKAAPATSTAAQTVASILRGLLDARVSGIENEGGLRPIGAPRRTIHDDLLTVSRPHRARASNICIPPTGTTAATSRESIT